MLELWHRQFFDALRTDAARPVHVSDVSR
jgi:hypothetical protein